MRIEIAGAQITDAVVEVLDTLQNQPGHIDKYIEALNRYVRIEAANMTGDNAEADAAVFERLGVLQSLRQTLLTLSAPPDADLPENDIPTASL